MKLRFVRSIVAVGLALGLGAYLWSPSQALAQTGAGSVAGTVRDPSESVVPGATVTITNTETKVSSKVQSSDQGGFFFGALQRGPYTLVAEKQGFKRWEGTLVVRVGEDLAVNPVLTVGSFQEVVEVRDAAPLINTQSSEISNVKDFERVRQLPLNGREVTLLLNLTPGLEGQGSCSDRGNPTPCSSFRVNGLKTGSLDISLDGVSLVDRFGGGSTRVLPGLDTIQEFRVETVGSDARYSRPATVTLSSRSGTNELHGSLFETHRNNSGGLRARRREESDNLAKIIRNEFGGSVGGPVYIPGLYDGRQKTFFFASYEGMRESRSRFYSDTVPTAAMWDGDFSSWLNLETPIIIYDPLTTDSNFVRQPFPNNTIPADRISAFAKLVQPLTALPTSDVNPYDEFNFFHFYPARTSLSSITAKVDHHFTEKDYLAVRWTRSKRHQETLGGVFGAPREGAASFGSGRNDVPIYNISATYNRLVSNNFLNELVVGVQRSANNTGTLADFTDWATKLGLPNPFTATGWPTFYADDVGANGGYGWDADNRKIQALTSESLEDNVTWTRGKHTVLFGGRFRREQSNVSELQQAQGSHDFPGIWTALADPGDPSSALPNTGIGLADMLLGLPNYLSNQYNRGFFYFRQSEFGFYATDRWKVTPRLTLNFGLRWDKWTPYQEKYNRIVNVDFNSIDSTFQVITPGNHDIHSLRGIPPAVLDSWAGRGLTYATAASVGYPDSLFRADNNNFGPRIGAAFQINSKTVLRGGYGEYFWTMPLSQLLQASRQNAPLNLVFENPFYGPGADGLGDNFSYALQSVPSANNFVGSAIVNTEGIVELPGSARTFAGWDGRNWKDARAQAWNVSLERVLPFQTTVRVSYLGNHASDLEQKYSVNNREGLFNYATRTGLIPPSNRDLLRVNPNWNMNATNRTGFSNSHLGQVEVEHRFAQGIVFQWFYAYTRSLTTSDAGGFSSGSAGINDTALGGAVPANNQIFGAPNLSYSQRRRLIYYNSTEVPPHHIRYNAVVDLPFGRGKLIGRDASGILNKVIGGWQVASIGEWRSGNWLSVASDRFQAGNPRLSADQRLEMDIFGSRQRLWFKGDFDPSSATNVTGGGLTALEALVPVERSQRTVRPFGPNCSGSYSAGQLAVTLADDSCYNAPVSDIFNPSRRAGITGPGYWNTDLTLYKNLKFNERVNLRFAADFFNAFNHPNDVNPNSRTGLQNLRQQVNEPRIMQFSLRLDW